jgi:hypothetical protein
MIFTNPFQQIRMPSDLFLEAIGIGHTDKAAAGHAGWTIEEAELYVKANPREYAIADNKRQHSYESFLIATGRGPDIARVALRQETRSWVQKAEPIPLKSLEDYLD